MQIAKTIAVAMAVLVGTIQVTYADDAVWRSSRPIRVRASTAGTQSRSAQHIWDRIEYPLLVQRLQSEIDRAQAGVEFWELRLENYDQLRFTDATQTAIKHAENSLQAARRYKADTTRKLALVRHHRVALGQLRAQMLQRSRVTSQLDR